MNRLFAVLTIAAVWSFEAVNTAIEAICDRVSPEHHELIGVAKDVAAGAVLVAAIAAMMATVPSPRADRSQPTSDAQR